jgi:hypothetical protein
MSDEKTPEQVAQEAQDSLNKIIATEAQKMAQQHITAVQLRLQAVQLSMKFFEDGFDTKLFEVADQMAKYLATGQADTVSKPQE